MRTVSCVSDDHYELDTTLARERLGWRPRDSIRSILPKIVASLKSDPLAWYTKNGLIPPSWLETADERSDDADKIRAGAERAYRNEHERFLWAPFLNMGLGLWLITDPPLLGYQSHWMVLSDAIAGILIFVTSFVTLSWRFGLLRWIVAALGVWVMTAPLIFWAPTAAAYLNGTLVGALVSASE